MPTKKELEGRPLVALAVGCGEISDDDSIDSAIRGNASELRLQWIKLIAQETPSPSSAEEQNKIEAEKDSLKERMVEFLAVYLHE